MSAYLSLTVFQIRSAEIKELDDAVRMKTLGWKRIRERTFGDFSLRLYLPKSRRTSPPWLALVREFGLNSDLTSVSNRALILVQVTSDGVNGHMAFAFGHGRHMLRPEVIDRGFGLRAALNAMYEDGGNEPDPVRVQQIVAKTIAQTTMRTNRQASSVVEFEQFDLDIENDMLSAVTGVPVNNERWGNRIRGADAITIKAKVSLEALGPLAMDLMELGQRMDYRDRFDWIDHVNVVDDPTLLTTLRAEVVNEATLQSTRTKIAPPELIDWSDVSGFRFRLTDNNDAAPQSDEHTPNIDRYLQLLAASDKDLSFELMQSHYVEAINSNGETAHKWPIAQALVTEVQVDEKTYLLEEGNFYQIETEFMDILDTFVDHIDEAKVCLPNASVDAMGNLEREDSYNNRAAGKSTNHLLLDKKLIRVASTASPIEVCDVLTSRAQFIHIKRNLGSSTLSHLFSQGYISADAYLTNSEFRNQVRSKIEEAAPERAHARRFLESLKLDSPSSRHIEVVYAVIAKWDGRKLSSALPFFSKINLRRTVRDLRRSGFRVSFRQIDIVE